MTPTQVTWRVGRGQGRDADPYTVLAAEDLRIEVIPREASVVMACAQARVTITGISYREPKHRWQHIDDWIRSLLSEMQERVMHARFTHQSANEHRQRLRDATLALAALDDQRLVRPVLAFYMTGRAGESAADWAALPVTFAKGRLAQYRALAEVSRHQWSIEQARAFLGTEPITFGPRVAGEWALVARAGWSVQDWRWARSANGHAVPHTLTFATGEQVRHLREQGFSPDFPFLSRVTAEAVLSRLTLPGPARTLDVAAPPLTTSGPTIRQLIRHLNGWVVVATGHHEGFGHLQSLRAESIEVLHPDGRSLTYANVNDSPRTLFGTAGTVISELLKHRDPRGEKVRLGKEVTARFEDHWRLADDTPGYRRDAGWLARYDSLHGGKVGLTSEEQVRWSARMLYSGLYSIDTKRVAAMIRAGWDHDTAADYLGGARVGDGVFGRAFYERLLHFAGLKDVWTAGIAHHMAHGDRWREWLALADDPQAPELALDVLLDRSDGPKVRTFERVGWLASHVGCALAREVLRSPVTFEEAVRSHADGTLSVEGLTVLRGLLATVDGEPALR